VETINVAGSSVRKGESFSDTMMTLQAYSDAIVARTRGGEDQRWSDLNGQVKVPVINAGDGMVEHPTQAMLDLYTIRRERGTVNGLKIALVGDLKHGRTVHSLVKLLAEYRVELMYISPSWLSMPTELVKYVSARGIEQSVHEDLDDIIEEIDILYVTRIQEERMEGALEAGDRQEMIRSYYVTPKKLTRAKDNLVIMHPLPRRGEISPEIDSDPRAAYFRQMENGMWARMALMDLILNPQNQK
jgi:carbamoyl-phosphate synthase/aspartate carbamoyltransferase/dihydroorotase